MLNACVQLQDLYRRVVKGAWVFTCNIPSSYLLCTSGLKIQYPDVNGNSFVLLDSPRAVDRGYAPVPAEGQRYGPPLTVVIWCEGPLTWERGSIEVDGVRLHYGQSDVVPPLSMIARRDLCKRVTQDRHITQCNARTHV